MTRQALCYRVEQEDGTGMYSVTPYTNACGLYDTVRHPAPERDAGLKWNVERSQGFDDWHFGFCSIEQMRRWIHQSVYYARMSEYGLAISIYLCEDYQIGDTQMVFLKSKATLVGRFNLRE